MIGGSSQQREVKMSPIAVFAFVCFAAVDGIVIWVGIGGAWCVVARIALGVSLFGLGVEIIPTLFDALLTRCRTCKKPLT
jgi:hypothetical protein